MDGYIFIIWILLLVQAGNLDSCSENSTKRNGIIWSPNYPKNYNNNLNCTWEIRPDNGGRIVLNLHNFFLQPITENLENVCLDYLMIYDGEIKDENILVNKTCWSSIKHKTVISSSERMLIVLKTDSNFGYKGFNASWETCGGTFVGWKGSLTSPTIQYDIYNSDEYVCLFDVRIPDNGSAVQIDVSATTFYPDECLIQIEEINETIGTNICTATDPRIYVSKTNEVKLMLTLVKGSNFTLNASYKRYDCSREITNTTGVLQSPNYSDRFDRDSVCYYVMNFSLSDQQLIQLILNETDFSCNGSDVLEIIQHNSNGDTNVTTLCKDDETNVLYMRENDVIRFISMYDGISARFSLGFSIVEVPISTISSVTEQVPRQENDYFGLFPIIVGVSVGIIVIIVIVIIVVFVYHRNRANQASKPHITAVNNTTANFTDVKAETGDSRVTLDYEQASLPTYSLPNYSNFASKNDNSSSTDRDEIYQDTGEDQYDILHTSRQKVSPGKGDNLYDVSVKDDQYDQTRQFALPNMDDDHQMYDSAKQCLDEENLYDLASNNA